MTRLQKPLPSFTVHRPLLFIAGFLALGIAAEGFAYEIDGFTEPSKKVEVASAETGIIRSITVQEGDQVEDGQVVVRLDDDIHQALLAIAEEALKAQGQLKSARAEVRMRQRRLEKLEALREHGHARQEEVTRARADLEIAQARELSAVEALRIKQLERDKVQIQVNRRAIRAPIKGVVSKRFKDVGEFVVPNDPHVLELVCLDPLMGTFNVPSHLVTHLKVDQKVTVFLEDANKWVDAYVTVIAPVTEAESSTVRVKVRIPNRQGKYRSGEHCTLQLKSSRAVTRP